MTIRNGWKGGAALALAVLVAAPALAEETAVRRTITVAGVGLIELPPDHARLELRILSLAPMPREAQSRNDELTKGALRALKEHGVAEEDLSTDFLSVAPKYRDRHGPDEEFQGHEASRDIRAILRDLTRFESLSLSILGDGSGGISIRSVRFASNELASANREARLAAIRAAREKAAYLSGELGQRVGDPVTIVEGHVGSEETSWRFEEYLGRKNAMATHELAQGRPIGGTETILPRAIRVVAEIRVVFELVN